MRKLSDAKEEIKTRSPDVKKAVKMYTIELLVFAVVFIVLGVLELLGIIGNNTGWRSVFVYITLVGVVVFIVMSIITLSTPEKRAKNSVLDKVILIPGPVAILVLDIFTLINGVEESATLHRYIIGFVFLYFGACYIFQAVYHYFFPLPLIYEVDEAPEGENEEGSESEGKPEDASSNAEPTPSDKPSDDDGQRQ